MHYAVFVFTYLIFLHFRRLIALLVTDDANVVNIGYNCFNSFIYFIVKMSMHTLPILLINLNGEMLYILEQRLRAQNIAPAKIRKGSHTHHPPRKPVLVVRRVLNSTFGAILRKNSLILTLTGRLENNGRY